MAASVSDDDSQEAADALVALRHQENARVLRAHERQHGPVPTARYTSRELERRLDGAYEMLTLRERAGVIVSSACSGDPAKRAWAADAAQRFYRSVLAACPSLEDKCEDVVRALQQSPRARKGFMDFIAERELQHREAMCNEGPVGSQGSVGSQGPLAKK
jgi:hypothetical protein